MSSSPSPLPQPAAPAASNGRVLVSRHPLIAHKMCLLRDATTRPAQFRLLVKEIASLLAYEATAKLPVIEEQELRQSPTGASYHGVKLGPKIGLVPIMRAGTGMVEA
ncbi:uracil phosphoribosyltransferase-domain-containing protein, partial [Catenaria anguillulae PL171]